MSQKTELSIHLLTSADHQKFFQMLELFGEVFEEPHTYCEKQPSAEYVSKLLARENFISLVALKGDNVVGALAAYVLEKFEQERSEIYIYDLAVSEKFRRQKVATNLISALCEEARIRGAYVIFVQADLVDEPAIALYESLGEREEVLHYDINPNSGADGV